MEIREPVLKEYYNACTLNLKKFEIKNLREEDLLIDWTTKP